MKKYLILFLLPIYLIAIDQAAAIQMVKNNPAILNTPQAQAMMKEKGISTAQVQEHISQDKTSQTQTESISQSELKTVEQPTNNIFIFYNLLFLRCT